MSDKEKIKQLKLSENIDPKNTEDGKEPKPKKEKEKPASKSLILLILIITILFSLFFKYVAGQRSGVSELKPRTDGVLQSGEYAF